MRRASHPVAFWLIPSEPARSSLARSIADLAHAHAAPAFTPHVTLFSGQCSEPVTAALCRRVLERAPLLAPVEARVTGIGHSEAFFKTVFLELAADDALVTLRAQVRDRFSALGHVSSAKPFQPHLSLIYKRCSPADRAPIVSAIQAPSVIACGALAAVVPGSGTWGDVAAWRSVYVQTLRR